MTQGWRECGSISEPRAGFFPGKEKKGGSPRCAARGGVGTAQHPAHGKRAAKPGRKAGRARFWTRTDAGAGRQQQPARAEHGPPKGLEPAPSQVGSRSATTETRVVWRRLRAASMPPLEEEGGCRRSLASSNRAQARTRLRRAQRGPGIRTPSRRGAKQLARPMVGSSAQKALAEHPECDRARRDRRSRPPGAARNRDKVH